MMLKSQKSNFIGLNWFNPYQQGLNILLRLRGWVMWLTRDVQTSDIATHIVMFYCLGNTCVTILFPSTTTTTTTDLSPLPMFHNIGSGVNQLSMHPVTMPLAAMARNRSNKEVRERGNGEMWGRGNEGTRTAPWVLLIWWVCPHCRPPSFTHTKFPCSPPHWHFGHHRNPFKVMNTATLTPHWQSCLEVSVGSSTQKIVIKFRCF